jgi:glycosyltransferase involved in cell wall biosynthesis
MHVIFICNEYPPFPHGGVGTAVRLLARQLTVYGCDVTVLGPYPRTQTSIEADGKVRIIRLASRPIPKLGWLASRFTTVRALRALVSARRVDVIVVPDWLGLVPWNPTRKPLVAFLHGTCHFFNAAAGRPSHPVITFMEKTTLKASSAWISPSKYALKETARLFKLEPACYSVIPNPVEMRSHNISENVDPYLILFVGGSLAVKKGVLSLAEAAREFLKKDKRFRLVFLGRSVMYGRSRIEQDILRRAGSGVSAQIEFHPPVVQEQVWTWMRKARVCVMPSFMETFGNVWAEAMACGRPVIGSITGPGPEVIQDGITGLLADPYSPEDIAQKVLRILNDSKFGEWLGQNAYDWAKARFSVEKVAEGHLAFYQRLLNMCQ